MICTAVATLERRRGDRPALLVGKGTGHGRTKADGASGSLTSMRAFELRPAGVSTPASLHADDLRAAVREAVTAALDQLVEPIDRELEPAEPDEPATVR